MYSWVLDGRIAPQGDETVAEAMERWIEEIDAPYLEQRRTGVVSQAVIDDELANFRSLAS